MVHYLNVCDVSGSDVEPVDIITFGSPCQDLSIAGKQKGLSGNRSGLFMEAVRIIKEMRESTGGEYPKYALWENVPGAFSSNKGEDFRTVIEELCRICDETVFIPRPAKQKWRTAGTVVGDGWSVAWRVLDAKYHGVPQRRRRIFLVTDFAGECAAEILFKQESLPGNPEEGFGSWEGTARSIAKSTGSTICLNNQGGNRMDVTENVTCTLRAEAHHPPLVFENHSQDSRYTGPLDVAQTVLSTFGTGGNNQPFVVETPKTLKIRSGCEGGGKGALIQENKSATLSCNNDQTVFVPFVKGTRPHSPDEGQQWKNSDTANTLNTYDVGESRCNELAVKVYGICSKQSHSMLSDNPHSGFYEAETSRTLDTGGGNPACNQGGMAVVSVQGSMIGRSDKNGPQGSGVNEDVSFTLDAADRHAVAYCMTTGSYAQALKEQSPTLMVRDYKDPPVVNETGPCYIVRRLTPTECARLQGFPENWAYLSNISDMTDEDYNFWTNVRKEYAKVNGKKFTNKSKEQTIKWYNKLHTDSSEYKMWGNGVALPCVLVPISEMSKRGCKTLGSLFDGSGGFPLAGVICGIKPLWCSEIEPYPIAVTKNRFG